MWIKMFTLISWRSPIIPLNRLIDIIVIQIWIHFIFQAQATQQSLCRFFKKRHNDCCVAFSWKTWRFRHCRLTAKLMLSSILIWILKQVYQRSYENQFWKLYIASSVSDCHWLPFPTHPTAKVLQIYRVV